MAAQYDVATPPNQTDYLYYQSQNHNIYNTENKKQYTAKDFSVSNFYGVYNGYYVVKVKRQDIDEIYSRREKEIFGVKFYLPSAFAVDKTWIDFIIWKAI